MVDCYIWYSGEVMGRWTANNDDGELHGLSSVDETDAYLTVVYRQSCL